MKKAEAEMRAEYKRSDLATFERGKFFKAASKGTSVALIEPKLAKAFLTSEAVNEALRGLLTLADEPARITGRTSGPPAIRPPFGDCVKARSTSSSPDAPERLALTLDISTVFAYYE